MRSDAEKILEKNCPSMNNIFLDKQGREFKERIINAIIEYRESEAIKSICDCMTFEQMGYLPIKKCVKCDTLKIE